MVKWQYAISIIVGYKVRRKLVCKPLTVLFQTEQNKEDLLLKGKQNLEAEYINLVSGIFCLLSQSDTVSLNNSTPLMSNKIQYPAPI